MKIFERIVDGRIHDIIQLSNNHCGFVAGCGTTDVIHAAHILKETGETEASAYRLPRLEESLRILRLNVKKIEYLTIDVTESSSIKVDDIELPRALKYWAVFEIWVHKNVELHVIEKILLLTESLKGRAKSAIQGIQPLPHSYEWMIQMLKDTYCDHDEWRLGPHGTSSRNENGERLIDFLSACRLYHGNSMFRKPSNRRWTWEIPDGETRSEIDHVLTNRRWSLFDVSVLPSFDTGSDHRLVRAKLTLKKRMFKRDTHKPAPGS
ncbi:unnamed protein product [Heligmosomoides polygyrus]|uniref:Endo/exonuclease/phosphatase domain-containing protein n=1 Tax=Heligmosomoides polygyrus TaxID=6339 RepID=A0A183F6R0_HELPZ|nr:unnamed protein product [Heligmosomoides polygyrus]